VAAVHIATSSVSLKEVTRKNIFRPPRQSHPGKNDITLKQSGASENVCGPVYLVIACHSTIIFILRIRFNKRTVNGFSVFYRESFAIQT
jgi:hypothetical protein